MVVREPRMCPVFERPLAQPPAALFAALATALADKSCAVRGQIHPNGALLRLRSGDQRVWSPALHVEMRGEPGGPWTLRGCFTPSSPVWTAFVAIYLGLAILFLAAISWGGAQMILGETPWAFWGAALAPVLAGFTYGAAFIGQGLGAEDMYELRSFLEGVADRVAVGGGGATAAVG
ncbi:MAG: hypothetical protein JNK15_21985 [Planctomycetes bacterium]|nr:hypothetical protein [Planctomycetota bacterium]